MNNLYTITSNSLKYLVNHLANDIRKSPESPLSLETVIVQSSGMSRWINIEIARLNGVCAGIVYKFPNAVIDEIFSKIVPEAAGPSPFDPDILCWRIMKVLPDFIDHEEFETVRNYCSSCVDDRGLLQFSRKVADCFDQYTIYRPEMLLEWDRGIGSDWQPLLWRAVSEGYQEKHRAAMLNTFRERISSGLFTNMDFPAKIRLFGVSYLPPFHLEILSLLSATTEIAIYILNPCGEYWGDIISQKKLASISLKRSFAAEAQEYYETGNPLLSSLGTMGQEFFNMLLDYGANCESTDFPIIENNPDTLLSHVQSDILHMRDRVADKSFTDRIARNDRSVQIHSCHGPMREMQVLYDNLLQMFTDMPDLEPRQIIVMTPDIESYAPYISAVFGADTDHRPEIPFNIADRSQCNENPEIVTFMKILKLPGSRFGINQVLDLLESDAIMTCFDLLPDEISVIREWLLTTHVKWGIDASHREDLGFPSYSENSWHSAIDRLLLGFALPPENCTLFNGISPVAGIEGTKTAALGKLVDFFNQIELQASRMNTSRTLTEWADTLSIVIKNLMRLPDPTSNSLKPVYEVLQKLRDEQQISGFNQEISLDALILCLSDYFNKPGASFGFMGGKVTFCAMLPMRSIPFRVICMVGMNDSVFPRISRQPGFSMMNGKRLCGDRSLREEDRYLFLEALMSAEERLFISYTGQSCRDNSEIPPSVVVSELLDYIDTGFAGVDDSVIVPLQTTIRHKLQAFSPAYFSGDASSRLFSYSKADYLALKARHMCENSETLFCVPPLQEPENDFSNVPIQNLIRFFSNPAAHFLVRRLGVKPERLKAVNEERESFNLDSLDNYSLKQDMVRLFLEGSDCDEFYDSARAASRLPPLAAGQFAFDTASSDAKVFANKVIPHLHKMLEPLSVSLPVGEFVISGQLSSIRSEQHLRYRCANIKGKDRLEIWIEHLVLNAIASNEYPRSSLLICRDATMALPPVENAVDILQVLLDTYRQGLCKPLHFFAESSLKMLQSGLTEAEKCWYGSGFGMAIAESDDPAYKLCFGRKSPLDDEFSMLAQLVYAPLLELAHEEKL